jgi:hypothetical protein
MKLEIELVPGPAWENNLRNVVPKSKWNQIRIETLAKYGNKCAVCGSTERLSCHEIWKYDDVGHIQKLQGFVALCFNCHMIKHIGLAGVLAKEGKMDFNKLVEHYVKVNECDLSAFEAQHKAAFEKWKERSKYEWKLDLGKYANGKS